MREAKSGKVLTHIAELVIGRRFAPTRWLMRATSLRRLTNAGLCVARLARQHGEIDTDLLERHLVLAAGIGAENQIGIGRAMQPAIMLDLVFQLPRCPSRITERENRAARAGAARDRFEDIERRREADPLVDRQG